ATTLLRGEFVLREDRREVGMVTAARPRPSGLLAAPPPGRGRRVRGRRVSVRPTPYLPELRRSMGTSPQTGMQELVSGSRVGRRDGFAQRRSGRLLAVRVSAGRADGARCRWRQRSWANRIWTVCS